MQCINEGCTKEAKGRYCPSCAKASMKLSMEKYRTRKKAEKAQLKAEAPPKTCAECGVEIPQTHKYCDEHKKKAKLKSGRAYQAALRAKTEGGPVHIGFKKSKPAPLTDLQRDQIDAQKRKQDLAFDKQLAARCGYGHSAPRSLTNSEIEALAPMLSQRPAVKPVIAPYAH